MVRICNRVWKGKRCNRENSGCNFPHPTICSDARCVGEAGGCTAFHPPARFRAGARAAGNGSGGARQGSGASDRRKPRGETCGGKGSPNNNNSNSNNSSRPTYSQLQERLAAMKVERSRKKGIWKDLRELRELSNLNISATACNLSYADAVKSTARMEGGFVPGPQLQPGLLNAVVAAMMAVLRDKGRK